MSAKKPSSNKNPLARGKNKILVLIITALLTALVFLIFYSLQLSINSEKLLKKNLTVNNLENLDDDPDAWRRERPAVPLKINLPVEEITEANIFLSPSHLVAWLNENFQLTDEQRYTVQNFEDFLATKQGNVVDWAVFSADILKQGVFEAGVLRYDYSVVDAVNNQQIISNDGLASNFIVVYRDGDLPQYLAFTSEGALLFNYGESFKHVLAAEENRLGITVSRYLYFPAGASDLSAPIYNFDWVSIN